MRLYGERYDEKMDLIEDLKREIEKMDGELMACYRAFCKTSSPFVKSEAKSILKKRFEE